MRVRRNMEAAREPRFEFAVGESAADGKTRVAATRCLSQSGVAQSGHQRPRARGSSQAIGDGGQPQRQ
jgi:hypothetical protein